MKVLITGANGFLGKNLTDRLNKAGGYEIFAFDIDSTTEELNKYTSDCDYVFNFAAVHRPKDNSEFDRVNHIFFDDLLAMLKGHGNTCPVLYTSSIQATNGSDYGKSKLAAEADLIAYGEETGAKAVIYRLTNVYGRWAMPNHHSVVATFCNNIAHGQEIVISDRNIIMNFYYIDDVIDSFMSQLKGEAVPDDDGIYRLTEDKIHTITLGELADTFYSFEEALKAGEEPIVNNETQRTLLLTYKSYRE